MPTDQNQHTTPKLYKILANNLDFNLDSLEYDQWLSCLQAKQQRSFQYRNNLVKQKGYTDLYFRLFTVVLIYEIVHLNLQQIFSGVISFSSAANPKHYESNPISFINPVEWFYQTIALAKWTLATIAQIMSAIVWSIVNPPFMLFNLWPVILPFIAISSFTLLFALTLSPKPSNKQNNRESFFKLNVQCLALLLSYLFISTILSVVCFSKPMVHIITVLVYFTSKNKSIEFLSLLAYCSQGNLMRAVFCLIVACKFAPKTPQNKSALLLFIPLLHYFLLFLCKQYLLMLYLTLALVTISFLQFVNQQFCHLKNNIRLPNSNEHLQVDYRACWDIELDFEQYH